MLYDPAENTHAPFLPDWDIRTLSISANGRLAFLSSHDGTPAIYALDYPSTNSIPVKITSDTSTGHYPVAWSPDGRYLAYGSFQNNETTLSIWDGKGFIQIFTTSARISIHEFTWSSDGRLAFTTFDFPNERGSEIFIWDGNKTVSLTQNPYGEDRYPAWSDDGRLAFLSEQADVYDIFIWDGTNTINGLPDVHSFNNIAPSLTRVNSKLGWSNSGSLTFRGIESGSETYQIYEWNGSVAANISQIPGNYAADQRWRNDGYWSFATGLHIGSPRVYIRDGKNKTQLTLKGYGIRWSESGYFIYCQRTILSRWELTEIGLPKIVKEYGGWTLSLGNGSKITEIAQAYEIEAIWGNGERVTCKGR
jgi:WD40 repeat protein